MESNSASTAGTIFASRKLPIRDYLAAVAIFCNNAKGISALALGRDLNVQYKTAFVLTHKLREVMGSEVQNPDEPELSGTVEIDGAYFGGSDLVRKNRRCTVATTWRFIGRAQQLPAGIPFSPTRVTMGQILASQPELRT